MIEINTSRAKQFLSEDRFSQAYKQAEKAFELVQQRNGEGTEWLGWRDLLADPNDAILEQIDSLATNIREQADVFIVCGIGGSYLGARAVIEALGSFFGNDGPEIIFAGHHMSGKYLKDLIGYLDKPNKEGEPKSVFVNVISKSGTTLETALSFRVLRKWMTEQFPEDVDDRIICTTSKEGGALNELIDQHGYKKFIIPDDVGGRFSVLTPVGLFPIAVAGIDIRTLFYEAVSKYEELEEDAEQIIDYAATKYALFDDGKTLDVLTTFEPQLEALGGWLQQLLGESEGKQGKGMFPATATYSTDLHSIGQFIQQGTRNMMETFITVKSEEKSITIEELPENNDGLNYLSGKTFHEINTQAFRGTLQAHTDGDVPSIVVSLDKLNAQHIGEFIYFYELLTAVYCYCLGVNPFNQPGVEDYKREMYQLLGKH
ncbi:glucose-6-phosphate isomerase [Aliifodinibius salipaludis]|uniref:Glucose-6-phosphate isomerase n=1 Tax=Fodinibius salipaludis TaxID=2032627 RepID=A0A2A2G7R6_9BACT|nr:glucose-6-phosphate isomerase [Aliifodinibius salipaludis]PAU92873.1 glucose-6-phosphate isomerase [Aliifodinibius salipaludis]